MMGLLRRLFRRAPPPALVVPVPAAPRVAPGEAFTPTQPKAGRRRLIGRQAELARILQSLSEDRAHVVLYSERGRGKTSLSNMAVQALRQSGITVARTTCEAGTDFDSMMRGLLRDLPPALLASSAGADAADGEGCEAALPAGTIRPRDVAAVMGRLACRNLVCLIDEFDRVEDVGTRTRLADTIKLLSDRDSRLLFLIVGVSDNLEQILGQHPSIQRSLVGLHLPLLSEVDVMQLIIKGGRESGFTFQQSAIARIVVLARGMPYIAQLLGLRLTQAAAARNDTAVSEDDFHVAVTRMVGDAQPRTLARYAALTENGHDLEMAQVLRRINTAAQDAWGRLQVTPLDSAMLVGGQAIPLARWQRLIAEGVLVPAATGTGLYVFAERSLSHHVLLLAACDAGQGGGAQDEIAYPDGAAGRTLQLVSQG